jgi:hypothetical protein
MGFSCFAEKTIIATKALRHKGKKCKAFFLSAFVTQFNFW